MKFKDHSGFRGQHAFLGGSKYHWINYDEDKLAAAYSKYLAIQLGTELHDLARRCIEKGVKLERSPNSLNQYVNDAIGFRMEPEQVLFYSLNAYGTCDAICFRNDVLRIHDLKTGYTRVSMHQLEVYSALFCLEYEVDPKDIQIELRIYQLGEILVYEPNFKAIRDIMEKIIIFDRRIEAIKQQEA